jgi:glycosyltransferase involved in cell wall biosynthesis
MAIVEAMAAGLPVVMTDVGCAGEIVRNEETGLVVPVDDEKALALAIMRLLEDTQLRTTLPSAGKEEVGKLATKDETLELYRRSWRRAYGKEDPIPASKKAHPQRIKKTKEITTNHAKKKKRTTKRA